MSKGSQVITMRFPAEELEAMDQYIQASEFTRAAAPWDRSAFIRAAVREKLAHLARSRKGPLGRKKRPTGDSDTCGDTPRAELPDSAVEVPTESG